MVFFFECQDLSRTETICAHLKSPKRWEDVNTFMVAYQVLVERDKCNMDHVISFTMSAVVQDIKRMRALQISLTPMPNIQKIGYDDS